MTRAFAPMKNKHVESRAAPRFFRHPTRKSESDSHLRFSQVESQVSNQNQNDQQTQTPNQGGQKVGQKDNPGQQTLRPGQGDQQGGQQKPDQK